jgi:hypothetical protein
MSWEWLAEEIRAERAERSREEEEIREILIEEIRADSAPRSPDGDLAAELRACRDDPDCSVGDAGAIVEGRALVGRAYREALESIRPLAEEIRAERAPSSREKTSSGPLCRTLDD